MRETTGNKLNCIYKVRRQSERNGMREDMNKIDCSCVKLRTRKTIAI
jgi:hypothetical protein